MWRSRMALNWSQAFLVLHLNTAWLHLFPFPFLKEDFQPQTKYILFSRFRNRTATETNVSQSFSALRSEETQQRQQTTPSLICFTHRKSGTSKNTSLNSYPAWIMITSSFQPLHVLPHFSVWIISPSHTYGGISTSLKWMPFFNSSSCAHTQHLCVEISLRVS